MGKKKSKKVLVRVAVVVLVFLVVCTFLSQTIYTANQPRVTVTSPIQAQLPISTNTTGAVVYDVTEVQIDRSLKVLKVDAASGDQVSAGDTVLEVDTSEFQIEEKQLQLAILQLQDQLNSTYSRSLRAQLNLQLEIAQDQLSLFEATVPTDGLVLAGCDGTIAQVYVEAGQTVPAGTTLFDIVGTDTKPQVQFSLPEEAAREYAVGSTVYLTYMKTTDVNGRMVTSSTQEKVAVTKKEYKDGAFLFTTDINKAGDATLYASMQVDVKAVASSNTYSAVVPLSAITKDQVGRLYIYVVKTRDGLFGQETYVEMVSVTKIAQNNISIALDEQEVNPFMQVVISTTEPLSDGETVKVEE